MYATNNFAFEREIETGDGWRVRAEITAEVTKWVGGGRGFANSYEIRSVKALGATQSPAGFQILVGAEIKHDITPRTLARLEQDAESEYAQNHEAEIVERGARAASHRLGSVARPSVPVASTEGEALS